MQTCLNDMLPRGGPQCRWVRGAQIKMVLSRQQSKVCYKCTPQRKRVCAPLLPSSQQLSSEQSDDAGMADAACEGAPSQWRRLVSSAGRATPHPNQNTSKHLSSSFFQWSLHYAQTALEKLV